MTILEKDFKVKGENYNNIRISCYYESRRYTLHATPETIEREGVWITRKTDSDALFYGVCETILTITGRKSKKSDQEALNRIDFNSVLKRVCEKFQLELAN